MATLPDPTAQLGDEDRAAYDRMAATRAHSDGRARLGNVYVRMFNNPGVAIKVGALGEHLRFHATLPDDVRELTILRFSERRGYSYELAHHHRSARLAGISSATINQLSSGAIPDDLPDPQRAALEVVDAVAAARSIPENVQHRLTAAYGTAGVVEVVALCGLYSLMGYMVTAFDIPLEHT